MKQQEIYKQFVEKEDWKSFSEMLKKCRDAYMAPLNIKDSEVLKKLKNCHSKLSNEYENNLSMYVVKLMQENNIDKNNIQNIIEFIEMGFNFAYLSKDSFSVLCKLSDIYEKYDININYEKIDLIDIIDLDVLSVIVSYYEKDNLKDKENGTKTSLDFYAEHYMENISLVVKAAYLITEIGDLNRFSQEWINDIKKFIGKYEKISLLN